MRPLLAAPIRWSQPASWLLPAALLLQLACIFRAFGPLLTEPGQHLLVTDLDGLKNYFTFQAYVQQPWQRGLSWFGMMNYPFGDYLFYADNTPLLVVPVRLWSHYIFDLRPYAIDIYHALLLAGLLLSTGLLVAILRRLLRHWGLVLVFAVVLPWLSPQTGRLVLGSFNLSYSCVLLLAVWGLLRVHERASQGQPVWRWVAGLTVGLALAGLLHLYYLPLLALFTAGFFGWWLLTSGRWREPRLVAAGAVLTLAPFGACVGLVRAVDAYYAQRLTKPTGFDYPLWQLQFPALFRHYDYETVRFLVEPVAPANNESEAYLGAFALFGLLLGAGSWLLSRRRQDEAPTSWPRGQFLLVLLGAATLTLLAALGTTFRVANEQLVVTNYFSAFFYLQKLTSAAAHFRAVGRFNWPFFWAINLLVLAGLDAWLGRSRWPGRWAVAAGLVLLALLDARDTLKHYRRSLQPNVLTDARQQPEVQALLRAVRPEQYQAILPVPFFHVGSEDLDLTLDDDDLHSRHSYQLALRTNLPLLASKMSRTPPEHARQLRTLFDPTGPAPVLRARLRAARKPLLVLFDARCYEGPYPLASRQTNPHARQLVEAGALLPQRPGMILLATAGTLRLYCWEL